MAKRCEICGKAECLEIRLVFQIKRATEVGSKRKKS